MGLEEADTRHDVRLRAEEPVELLEEEVVAHPVLDKPWEMSLREPCVSPEVGFLKSALIAVHEEADQQARAADVHLRGRLVLAIEEENLALAGIAV